MRALLGALVAWLPIVGWAAATGRLRELAWSEGTVRHLPLHFRCLLAIPLLILSEPIADRVIGAIVGNFATSGLILDDDRPAFERILRSVERLRDSMLVWSLLVAAVFAVTLLAGHAEALGLAGADATGLGPTWARFVVHPLFLLMLLAWLWRLALTWILFVRIARLDLQLVPSHPDRVGGLGFVELQPAAFSLVVLALSGLACSAVAEHVVEEHVHVVQFQAPLIALVVLLVVVFLCPLTAFGQRLRRTKMLARFQYGTLAGRHVRGLHRRWVEGLDIGDDPVLSAPEIGPAADVATLYELTARMRPLPIGLLPLIAVLLPAVLPLLPVATLEIPLKDILAKVLGMLT
jgi:hypothetical protein